jgi:hypothetical protein
MHCGCIAQPVGSRDIHSDAGDDRAKDTGSDFHKARAISRASHRSGLRRLIAPGPDCSDVHREKALTMDVAPINGRDSGQHPTLMTALSMN